MRFQYGRSHRLTEGDVLRLMQRYNSDAVRAFCNFVNQSSFSPADLHFRPSPKRFFDLRFCRLPLRYTRSCLNSFFTANDSFSYLLLSLILAWSTVTMFTPLFHFANSFSFSWVLGWSCCSLVFPPETDPWCVTRGDYKTGFVRSFTLLFFSSVWYGFYCLSAKGEIAFFDIKIDLQIVFEWADIILWTLIICLPLVVSFSCGNVVTFLMWLFEWIGRYGFGLSGFGDAISGCIQFVRAAAVTIGFGFGIQYWNDGIEIAAWTAGAIFLLQIPIGSLGVWFQHPIAIPFCVLFHVIICFSMTFLGSFVDNQNLIHILLFVSSGVIFIFVIVIPYIVSIIRTV
jgi:hypothetical protein